jgi:hypothetical protein
VKTKNSLHNSFFYLLVALSLATVACSADNGGTKEGLGGSSGTATSGVGGAGAGGMGGAGYTVPIGSSKGGDAASGNGGTGASFGDAAICGGKKVDPVPVAIQVETQVPYEVNTPQPIAIYIMLDRSQSMTEASGSSTKWEIVKESVDAFLNDPDSDFLDVGIQYFSIDGTNNPLSCPADYIASHATPAVPIGTLPDNATNILSSIDSVQLGGYTPMEAGLTGLTTYCAEYQDQHTDEPCVGVLISDGKPTMCNLDAGALVGIADNAYNNSNVKTFTVGMQGADFNLLDQIAMMGGTDCTPSDTSDGYACDVSNGMTLLEAFQAIRKVVTKLETKTETKTEYKNQIAECEWGLPSATELDAGEVEELEPTLVNVVFSQPNKDDEIFQKVAGNPECKDLSDAWYYDSETSPTKIFACEKTCDYIKSITDASINIQLGCPTHTIVR